MRDDPSQPKRQMRRGLDRLEIQVELQKHFLGEIVRCIARAEHAQREAVDSALMQSHERRERGGITGSRTRQVLIHQT